jgi:hypothetical protein
VVSRRPVGASAPFGRCGWVGEGRETAPEPSKTTEWAEKRNQLDLETQKLEAAARGKVRDRLIAELEQAVERHVAATDE